jgi:hypothetical protein
MTKKPKKTKKNKDEAILIMLKELRSMIPTFLFCNATALLICTIYCIAASVFDWRLFTGLLLGNTASILNFYFLGFKSARIIRSKDKRKAQVFTTATFFVRYFGAFIVFGILIRFGIINAITLVIPLFFPRIHYMVKAIFNKEL